MMSNRLERAEVRGVLIKRLRAEMSSNARRTFSRIGSKLVTVAPLKRFNCPPTIVTSIERYDTCLVETTIIAFSNGSPQLDFELSDRVLKSAFWPLRSSLRFPAKGCRNSLAAKGRFGKALQGFRLDRVGDGLQGSSQGLPADFGQRPCDKGQETGRDWLSGSALDCVARLAHDAQFWLHR